VSASNTKLHLGWILALAFIGGAFGALLRWGGDLLVPHLGGPLWVAILLINLLGAFTMGIVFTRLDTRFPELSDIEIPLDRLPGALRSHGFFTALFVIGGLGAFTTYSSFCLRVIELVQESRYLDASLLTVLSIALGPLAVWAGFVSGRKIWANSLQKLTSD
jgi:CrcB protein